MIEKDKLFIEGDDAKIWQKYCGFLDLSLPEFMQIQEHLLKEQIELVANSLLGKKIMGKQKPKSVEEFRQIVPLTTYDDYKVYFDEQREDVLSGSPYCWVHTTGAAGMIKWSPFTERAFVRLAENTLAAFILAGARRKGEVRIRENRERFLINLPSRPYLSGWLPFGVSKLLTFQTIPPMDISEKMEFTERVKESFRLALRGRVDFIGALATVLVKVSDSFGHNSNKARFSWGTLHPLVFTRLAKAWLRSKREGRQIMPKDLWRVKGIICGGLDTSFYKDQITEHWGVTPGEIYAATESGLLALSSWTKTNLVFSPYSVFVELIPEEELVKNQGDRSYQPSTVLLNEAEAGKRYEIVITNFYGMPFLRYRLGNIIRIASLEDKEAEIKLPQIELVSRADEIVDLGSFSRLDEKTIWQAINNTSIKYEDWVVTKKSNDGRISIQLYIELKEDQDAEKVGSLVHERLKAIDSNYNDLETMLGIRPLEVNLLARGTMQRYQEEKRKAGAHLSGLKPPHISLSDTVIQKLLELSRAISQEKG